MARASRTTVAARGGVIENNKILFNQTFDQTVTAQWRLGWRHLYRRVRPVCRCGTGRQPGQRLGAHRRQPIQGNFAGTGDGGGIALIHTNGQDLLASPLPANWNRIDITNNMIVNNVAALAGGGISLQDAPNTFIIHNTIANNDSSATAAAGLRRESEYLGPAAGGHRES